MFWTTAAWSFCAFSMADWQNTPARCNNRVWVLMNCPPNRQRRAQGGSCSSNVRSNAATTNSQEWWPSRHLRDDSLNTANFFWPVTTFNTLELSAQQQENNPNPRNIQPHFARWLRSRWTIPGFQRQLVKQFIKSATHSKHRTRTRTWWRW